MSWVLRTFGYVWAVTLLCAPISWAQSAPQVSPAPAQSTVRPKERLPSTVYLEKDDGSLIAIVGDIPWARFDELANMANEKPTDSFAIKRLIMTAKATESLVSITNEIEIHLKEAGDYRIPIQMSECNFLSQPKITSPDSDATVVAHYVQKRDEYELLIDSRQAGSLTIEFPTEVALRIIGNRKLLALSVPRVAVSRFELDVPEIEIEAKSVTGTAIETISTDSTTAFTINGLVPQFEFWWQPKGTPEDSKAFSVVGQVEAIVNDYGEVTRSVTLEASSFNHPLEGFVVQLPNDAKWDPANDQTSNIGYSVNSLGMDDGTESLQVVFGDPNAWPVPVRLRLTSQNAKKGTQKQSRRFDLGGFQVVGAASQSGTVRVISEGSWLLKYDLGDFSRRVGNTDENAKATFEYSRPGQVHLWVTSPKAELIVEPLYLLTIEEATARLTAKFRCTRRGADREPELKIEMKDWLFQSLGPDSDDVVIQIDELLAPNDGLLSLPLDPSTEKFEITVIATRSIDGGLPRATPPDAETDFLQDFEQYMSDTDTFAALEIDFPAIRDTTTLLPSLVALGSDANVFVTPSETEAYAEVAMPERIRAGLQGENSTLCLQSLSMGQPPVLPVHAALLERSTHIDIETQIIDIDPNRIRIREQMRWHVMDVPLSRVLLMMHRDISDYGKIQVAVDGQSVVPIRSPIFPASSNEHETLQVPIPLGLGSFEMTVTYDWTRRAADGTVLSLEGYDDFDVDLVLPRSSNRGRTGRISIRNEVRKPRIANYDVSLTVNRNSDMGWAWNLETDPDMEAFSTETELNILPITIRKLTASSRTNNFQELVDRAWFQTWYTKNARSDRAVFRVQGGDEDLQIEIPEALMDNVRVWVDGEEAEFRSAGDNLVDVSVDADQPLHVVELYTTVDTRSPVGRLTTSLPRIAGADVMGQWYWHVVMPRNECMVTWPRKLTRAHSWDWSSVYPRRKSEMTLAELESWSGAIHSAGKIHAGSSEYLFGAMGEPDDTLSIRTAPLPVYLLATAGSFFVISILMVYSKRKALVFVFLGLAICGLIFLHPSYASMAGQMSAFGIVLGVVVQLLLWLFQHSPNLEAKRSPESAPSSWIRRIDRSSRGETTTMEGGSSRYRNAQ